MSLLASSGTVSSHLTSSVFHWRSNISCLQVWIHPTGLAPFLIHPSLPTPVLEQRRGPHPT